MEYIEGMKVRITRVADNVDPTIKLYVGKTGKITGDGDSWMGKRGYYVQPDDGSPTQKFYEDEIVLTKMHIRNRPIS